jgi:hypothetical protein
MNEKLTCTEKRKSQQSEIQNPNPWIVFLATLQAVQRSSL